MIKGLGVDIVEISRMDKMIEKGTSLRRILTENEQECLAKASKKSEYLASRFAAKEAVAKAFGTGIAGCPLNCVEVLNNDLGAPYIKLYGDAYELKKRKFVTKVDISISHEKHYAVAVAIIE